jgi:hypothetical protein
MTRYIGDIYVSLLDRVLNKVEINQTTGCWEFQGGKNNLGYGMIRDDKKMRTTHRVSYEEHTQTKIPKHLVVMHSCDNPCCVNPAHLSLGTRQDNMRDMVNKGRAKPYGGIGHGMLGKKMPTTLCPHCNRNMPNNTYERYHGNNCKQKNSINRLSTN